jgi:hypothetical protein
MLSHSRPVRQALALDTFKSRRRPFPSRPLYENMGTADRDRIGWLGRKDSNQPNPTFALASAIQIRPDPKAVKGVEIQRLAKTVLSAKSSELQRKPARESNLGAPPRGQSPEITRPVSQSSSLWTRDLMVENRPRKGPGGGSGIRTHDTVARIHAFQACAFSHSAIPPGKRAI